MDSTEEVQQKEGEGGAEVETEEIVFKNHAKFFKRVLAVLPTFLSSLDSNRMTLLFFAVSGLDVLNLLDTLSDKEKEDIVEWIYAQQILPGEDGSDSHCGFRGASFIGAPFQDSSARHLPYDTSHVAMTYTALATLLILSDDLSRVNRAAVLAGLRQLQLPNGSFCSTIEGSENDMRFVYCAACVSYMLNDWSGMDVDKAASFIKASQNYDNGIAQGPFLESHGGSTFCGVAALYLMGKLEDVFSEEERVGLMKWCLLRQLTGFQGRPNKPVDTCYSFWVGATLKLLGGSDFVNQDLNRRYILSTEGPVTGGFSKWPDCNPDPLHTYLGLCGLSLNGETGLQPIHAALNISQRAAKELTQAQSSSSLSH